MSLKREIVKLDYLRGDIDIYQNSEYIRTLYWDSSPFIKHLFYSLLQTAISLAPENASESRIVDIGLAEGPFLPTMSKYFNKIIGLDINYDHIKLAKNIMNFPSQKLPSISLLLADGANLPFESNSCDIVFCLETLEHVSDITRVVYEISRILRRGGVLISSVPIETGFPLVIRQLAGKILGFQRDQYNGRELLDAVLERNLDARRAHENKMHSHRFFSWRHVLKEIESSKLRIDSIVFTPFSWARVFSTNATLRAIKI